MENNGVTNNKGHGTIASQTIEVTDHELAMCDIIDHKLVV